MGGWVIVVVAGNWFHVGSRKKVTLEQRVMYIPRPCEGKTGRAWHVSGITRRL